MDQRKILVVKTQLLHFCFSAHENEKWNMQAIITLPPEVNIIDDDLMAKLKAMTANVSYPVLTVCCKRSPSHQASARTPPGFGSAHLQLCQKPVKVHNKAPFCRHNNQVGGI